MVEFIGVPVSSDFLKSCGINEDDSPDQMIRKIVSSAAMTSDMFERLSKEMPKDG